MRPSHSNKHTCRGKRNSDVVRRGDNKDPKDFEVPELLAVIQALIRLKKEGDSEDAENIGLKTPANNRRFSPHTRAT